MSKKFGEEYMKRNSRQHVVPNAKRRNKKESNMTCDRVRKSCSVSAVGTIEIIYSGRQ